MAIASKSELVQRVHQEAVRVAADYKRSEVELIEILQQVDRHRVYHSYMYRSLFQYTTEALGLAEEVAYAFINISRKAQEIPALKEEIKSGAITFTKARRITSVINKENQSHWLELARNCSKQKLEREIAIASPNKAVPDRLTFVHPTNEKVESVQLIKLGEAVRVQLQAGISEKLMMDIKRAQEIISQRLRRPAGLEDTLRTLTMEYLDRHCPIKIAERQSLRGKVALRKQVFLKYQGQCAHRDRTGTRCKERRFLEVHHIKPVSEGGSDEIGNLQLLCSGHHRMTHS